MRGGFAMKKCLVVITAVIIFLASLSSLSQTSKGIAAGEMTVSGAGLEMRFLNLSKKIIPLVWKDKNDFWTTNIKMPEVVLTNRGMDSFTLKSIEVKGVCENGQSVMYNLNGNLLVNKSRKLNSALNQASRDGKLDAMRPNLAVSFGAMSLPEGYLSETAMLRKGESTILLLPKVLYVHCIGRLQISRLFLSVKGSSPAGVIEREFPLPLTPYRTKGSYSFPLRGNLQLANLPLNLDHHRPMMSQEFGFDVVEVGQRDGINYLNSKTEKPVKSSDGLIYHREILAAGDGTVVAVGSRFPDEVADQILAKPDSRMKHFNELMASIGFLNTLAGNYIVIDHGNGEFSFYAHISEGTIKVKAGDKVKKCMPIALVGNTGNSTGAHLHFQIMDAADMLTANGLPVIFEDIPINLMNSYFEEANSLLDSDNLYLHVPVKEWPHLK